MSSKSTINVGNLFGQLENYADRSIGALENARQEIQQLTTRVTRLEADLDALRQQLSHAFSSFVKPHPEHKAAAPLDVAPLDVAVTPSKAIEHAVAPVIENVVEKKQMEVEEVEEAQSTPKTEPPKVKANLDKLSAQERLKHWVATYPNVFIPSQPQPLKVGIHKELLAEEGGDIKKIRRALACYVKLPRYSRCIKEGAQRLDLQGNDAGLVTQEEAGFAQEHLQALEQKNKQPSAQKKQQGDSTEGRLQNKLSALMQQNRER